LAALLSALSKASISARGVVNKERVWIEGSDRAVHAAWNDFFALSKSVLDLVLFKADSTIS